MIDFDKAIKNAVFLPDDGYDKYWVEFNSAGVKAKKLEFLQTYAFIDGNNDFDNKDYDAFVSMLKDFYINAWGGKDNIKRIHFVERPVDPYLEMEYYTYLVSERLGQDIRITEDRKLFPKKVYDFVLFENDNLFILNFGNNDCWKGAWHVTDKKTIEEFSVWYDEVFAKCTNFKSMLTPNKEIINKMIANKIDIKNV